MGTDKNAILAVITLLGVMTFAGCAQASVTAWGDVNTTAVGELVTVWLDVNPSDYVIVDVLDGDSYPDFWYVSDLEPMLDRNGYNSGDTNISATAAMYCSGTERDIDGVLGSPYSNEYGSATVVHFILDYSDITVGASLMELEPCAVDETFSKTLYSGWNLISLPLTPSDNSTSAVLSTASYDAVCRYNETSKEFESADAMDPGTGYFVNATADRVWEYSGKPYTSMGASLKQGLNMVGWLNCSKNVDALSSISGKYHYVAQWNTSTQKFDVYNPAAPDSSAFNDFTTMNQGTGYFIAAKQDCALSDSC